MCFLGYGRWDMTASLEPAARPPLPPPGLYPPTEEMISCAARAVRDGALVILPTETVYGLAARADSPDAMKRLYAAKERPPEKPIARMVATIEQLRGAVGALPPAAEALAARFWPGPLTLVLRANAAHPDAEWVGYRAPAHPVALAWLKALGAVVPAVTSANRSGEPAAREASEAWAAVGSHTALGLDGGPAREGRGSTVVKVDGAILTVLREGPVSWKAMAAVLASEIPGCTLNGVCV